ncbi:MAG: hypothetical protein WC292_06960 [Clostridia bacterium]
MSKKVQAVIVIIMSLVAAIALTSCNNEVDTHKGAVSYDIATAADFLDIANRLGADYDEATFNLTADITLDGDNWQPIGGSIDNSFRGRLNGNNHMITLKVHNDSYAQLQAGHYGIFGYIYGASFYDLEVDVDYKLNTELDISFVGGLAGFAYGDNVFKNVTLNGEIELFPALKTEVLSNDDERAVIDKIAYLGGLVGYGTGKFTIDGFNSEEFAITAPQIARRTYVERPLLDDFYLEFAFSFENVYAGAAAGYIRTVDISKGATDRNTIKNAEVNPSFNIYARNIYAGGITGIIYNTDTQNIIVNGDSSINVPSQKHGYNGGAFGLADNSTIKNAQIAVDIKLAPEGNTSLNPSYCVGGAVGYAANGSLLEEIEIKDITIEITVERKAQAYCGGIVGVLRDSKLINSVSNGGFIVAEGEVATAEDFTNMAILNARGGHMFKGLAGAVGLMHGEAQIEDITINFIAYQGAVAEISSDITINRITDSEGEEQVESVEIDAKPEIGEGVVYNPQSAGAYAYIGLEAAYYQNAYGTGVLPDGTDAA